MTATAHAVLEAGRVQADLSFHDLWLAYFALGGASSLVELRSYLRTGSPASSDYDVVAQAINEHFVELGQNHPVPYRDELT